jgi:hypothetical protein
MAILLNVQYFVSSIFFDFFSIGGEPLGNEVTNIFALQPLFNGDYGSVFISSFLDLAIAYLSNF